MNLIDEALQKHLTAHDFLQAMGEIRKHPEIRDVLDSYPQWIRDVITILDYDTEMSSEGMENREYTPEIEALRRCGITKEAELLSMVHDSSDYAAMSAIYPRLAFLNEDDYTVFWNCINAYIDQTLT